jgi:hypothetical protein
MEAKEAAKAALNPATLPPPGVGETLASLLLNSFKLILAKVILFPL